MVGPQSIQNEEQKNEEERKESGSKKSGKKKKKKADSSAQEQKSSSSSGAVEPIDEIELRVGHINRCWTHPEADKLYCEEIDVGEEEPRQIASGLRPHYTQEEMEGRKVIVVCNLKAKNLVGFKSHGMVLCGAVPDGEDGEIVKFVDPPADAAPGDLVALNNETLQIASASRVEKKKLWKKVVLMDGNEQGLCLNEEGVLVFGSLDGSGGPPFHVYGSDGEDKGVCTAPEITSCIVR